MKKIILFVSICLALIMFVTSCGGNIEEDIGNTDDTEGKSGFFGKDTEKEESDPFALGKKYKADGDYEKAENEFKTVVANDSQNYLSYLELADIYIRQIKFQSAYNTLTEGYEITKNDAISNKLLDFNSANVVCDSDRNIKGKTHFKNGELLWFHEYVYDEETGLRKNVIYYGADGLEISRVDIAFNSKGQPLKGYAYYTHTGELEKLEFEYNSDGQLVKTNEYTIDGDLLGYSINEFDAEGYKTSEERFMADGSSHWKLEYIHDIAALESKRLTYFYGKLVGETNYTYTESGYTSGSTSRFKGEYDRTLDYDLDYESNHEREEVFLGDISHARVICYGAELSIIY